MKVNEVRIERTFNLGNFESTKVGLSVSPEPEEQESKDYRNVINDISKELKDIILNIKENKEVIEKGSPIQLKDGNTAIVTERR